MTNSGQCAISRGDVFSIQAKTQENKCLLRWAQQTSKAIVKMIEFSSACNL